MATNDFSKIIDLYNNGINIHKTPKIDSNTNRILRLANTDIRVINRDNNYSNIIGSSDLENFVKDSYSQTCKYFYMIPVQTPKGSIVGFIARNMFYKSYTTINSTLISDKKVPFMYGFYKDFLDYEDKRDEYPIVICEGAKDCIALKKAYPYVLANNTSSLGINASILSNVTRKIILAYDSDGTGDAKYIEDSKMLLNMGIFVDRLNIPHGHKDCGSCADNKSSFIELIGTLKRKITFFRNN